MLSQIFVYIFVIKFCSAQSIALLQLDVNFHDYWKGRPPPPMFVELSEVDTDESASIVFKDDDFIENSDGSYPNIKNNVGKALNEIQGFYIFKNVPRGFKTLQPVEKWIYSPKIGDKFVFRNPENDNFVRKDLQNTTTTASHTSINTSSSDSIPSNSTVTFNDKVSFYMNNSKKLSEDICTFMKKSECIRSNGVILNSKIAKEINTDHTICCVLPLKSLDHSKLISPDTVTKIKRSKRSDQGNVGQKQRNVLLQWKFSHQSHKPKPATQTKITSPDNEYDDPYWNVKHPNKEGQESNTGFDYNTDDYIDDYNVEIPKPGFVGLYSDHGSTKKTSDRAFYRDYQGEVYEENYDYDDYYNEETGFGYAIIDPRTGKNKKTRPREKPIKLSTASDEANNDAESQTISYHSYPNFNILPDFKLLNLIKNKSRSPSSIARTTTTESFTDNESKESLVTRPFKKHLDISEEDFEDLQVFKGCGKTSKSFGINNKVKQIGNAENGSHPWLAVVIATRKPNRVRCYATLLHPNAAISAATCVFRSSPGEIILFAGIWNILDKSGSESRAILYRVHPQYDRALTNNVAILYWNRPLQLGINVQPACMANPQICNGDEFMFVGWGGFDQGLLPRSQWQRATMQTCKRPALHGIFLPPESFCVSVGSQSTVTGIGGSLICNVHGRRAVAGVAVARDSTTILLPALHWATRTVISALRG